MGVDPEREEVRKNYKGKCIQIIFYEKSISLIKGEKKPML